MFLKTSEMAFICLLLKHVMVVSYICIRYKCIIIQFYSETNTLMKFSSHCQYEFNDERVAHITIRSKSLLMFIYSDNRCSILLSIIENGRGFSDRLSKVGDYRHITTRNDSNDLDKFRVKRSRSWG